MIGNNVNVRKHLQQILLNKLTLLQLYAYVTFDFSSKLCNMYEPNCIDGKSKHVSMNPKGKIHCKKQQK